MKRSGSAPEVNKGKELSGWEKAKLISGKINSAIDFTGTLIFRLRKFILAAPVVYLALQLFSYNSQHLPEMVGIGLLASGAYTMTVARGVAVMGPMALTLGCLALMFFSRKAMYAWAISLFTLTLPLLILVSNVYPA